MNHTFLLLALLPLLAIPLACNNKGGLTAPSSAQATSTPTAYTVYTIAGQAGVTGATNATGTNATFNTPIGLAIDSSGNLYVGDWQNQLVRKITSAGVVSTLAGQAGVTGATNATGTSATFNNPAGVAVDTSGNVYVSDQDNGIIRKITSGGVVSTFATNVPGNSGFNNALGIGVDHNGNVYLGDQGNNEVDEFNSSGTGFVLAGSGLTGSANGTGTAASFYKPDGIVIDPSGNVYVADSYNNLIRKITSAGVVTTLAGQAGVTGSMNGTGTAASFYTPAGLALDSSGNLYVADTFNDLIRKITPAGVVTTIAGQAGVAGSANGSGTSALFSEPIGIAVDSSGNLYVADAGSDLIRKIVP